MAAAMKLKFDMMGEIDVFLLAGDPLTCITLHICESCGFQNFVNEETDIVISWLSNQFTMRERFHPLQVDVADLAKNSILGSKEIRHISKFDMFFE